MKILYLRTVFWFGFTAGGSVAHTSGIINAFNRMGDIEVISNDTLPEINVNPKIVEPGLLRYIPMRLGELLYSWLLLHEQQVWAKTYDFIYQRYSGLSYAGVALSRHLGIPLILEFNSSDFWKINNWSKTGSKVKNMFISLANLLRLPIIARIERYNIAHATWITVVSEALKSSLIEQGVAAHKIIVVTNGVDAEKYAPNVSGDVVRKRLGLGKKTVVGFIGTFGPWHGVEELAEAIKLFFIQHPVYKACVRFLLIGDGKLMPSVRSTIEEAALAEQVVFAGRIAQHEGPQHLAACDILLSPHVKNPDGSKFFGSPTKLFEYMAMGKAIIASDLGQIGQILDHGVTAIMVSPGAPVELASAIHELIQTPELRWQLGRAARKRVIAEHTWDIKLKQMVGFLRGRAETQNGGCAHCTDQSCR